MTDPSVAGDPRPGDPDLDERNRQAQAEAEAEQLDRARRGLSPVPPPMPGRSAAKAAWVDYAVACGAVRAEAEGMTRDELVAEHG